MKFLMAANWKMFKTKEQATNTMQELVSLLTTIPQDREVAVFAPFTCVHEVSVAANNAPHIFVGGQNCYPATEGAFTGEISPQMLQDAGCTMVLTGHSERRALLGESDAFVGQKTAFALNQGLSVVLCIGETLAQRDAGQVQTVLQRQLEAGLADVAQDIDAERISIAYEPVWAIGTGRVAGPEEIIEAHKVVRTFLEQKFAAQGCNIRILYGGSVKPENAKHIISLKNVNGVLVGGASLVATSFSQIVLA